MSPFEKSVLLNRINQKQRNLTTSVKADIFFNFDIWSRKL